MKNMKAVLLSLLIVIPTIIQAQPDPEKMKDRHEEIESMKIGFITRKLDLSPEESQKFWPVYNTYNKEMEVLRKGHRSNITKLRNDLDELSDSEIETLVDKEQDFRQNELNIRKKYHQEFKKVLTMRKVAALYGVEEDFKRELLKMLRNKGPRDGHKEKR
jgi:hypothetical protein